MTPEPRPRPLVGMARIARGRIDGLTLFGDTPQAFLSSLAPLLAFPLVGALMLLSSSGTSRAVLTLLVTLVAQLAPPVLSHALARAWGREHLWLRYATAFNWCQWALPLAAMALLIVLQIGMAAGLPGPVADLLLLFGIAGYGLWLNWLLARHGLELSAGWAAGLVALVNIGTIVLALGPRLLLNLLR